MAFRPHCPKCGSSSVSVEKDRGGGWGNPEPMLHCRCGNVLYGEDKIRALFEAQRAAWESDTDARRAEAAAEEARKENDGKAREVRESHLRYLAEIRRRREAAEESKRADNLRWMEEARRARQEMAGPPEPEPAASCAWMECENPSSPGSKYCSVDCKNRNARWRYKNRRQ